MNEQYSTRKLTLSLALTLAFLSIASLGQENLIISSAGAAVAPAEGIPKTVLPENQIPEKAPLDFKALDTDGDGGLSQEELEAGHTGDQGDFKTADSDSSGSLNAEEFDTWLSAMDKPDPSLEGGMSNSVPNKDNCFPKSAEHPEGGKCFFP